MFELFIGSDNIETDDSPKVGISVRRLVRPPMSDPAV